MRRRQLLKPAGEAAAAPTIAAALAAAARRLGPGQRADAEVLLAHVLGVARSALVARDERALATSERREFERLLARRAAGEPVAYLTGTKEFWSLPLRVTRDVLIPRPETELLVEWFLSFPRQRESSLSVLDVGTGSGAIALAVAHERPDARVFGTDVSPAALEVARDNADRLGIGNVEFMLGRFYEPLDARFRGHDGARFDIIVSNPPYIAEGDPHLHDLRFEPAAALTAGADGLDALRTVIAGARQFLRAGGWLLVEHGTDQGPAVRELFDRAGFAGVETRRDLAGHERATGGQSRVIPSAARDLVRE